VSADVSGSVARSAVIASSDNSASFPHAGQLAAGPGNQGSAAQPMLGQVGCEGDTWCQPRLLAKGNAGSIGVPSP
jgi:hypothetical protein